MNQHLKIKCINQIVWIRLFAINIIVIMTIVQRLHAWLKSLIKVLIKNFKANIFLCYGKTCVSDTQNLHARIVYIFNINTCTVSQEHTKNQAILSVCLWTFYVMIDYI